MRHQSRYILQGVERNGSQVSVQHTTHILYGTYVHVNYKCWLRQVNADLEERQTSNAAKKVLLVIHIQFSYNFRSAKATHK